MKITVLALCALLVAPLEAGQAAERPNILWLVCEDSNVNWFGCYGNTQANTPNIDDFAKQGFRYTHAFASAPVCAPSRSGWITGINALSTGTLPMRSRYMIPHDLIKYYPDYLRQAGYYTSNYTKTDYNIGGRKDTDCWDSNVAHCWEKRKPGQPFFQVINFNESHESKAQGDVMNTRHSPGEVVLRKYHPDEMDIRRNYAKYYDAVENMDKKVGEELQALEKAGLAQDTIVIFCSDHGGVLPGSKRFLINDGVHSPLIVRVPEKFKQLWPAAAPGSTVDRLVSFLDMPKTWLSLTGAEIPAIMQGHAFLGLKIEPEPQYVFSFRERMDERFDSARSARDKRYAYIKNYMPYIAWGQHHEYMWKMVAMRSWEDAYKNHRTDDVTGRFFTLKPVEELYDMEADPDNVVNLADKPEHQKTMERMRTQLREWQLQIHDSGLLPEHERERRAADNHTTIYQIANDPKLYDLPAYLDAADLAFAKNAANAPRFVEALKSNDSGIRYWAVIGLLMLGKADTGAQAALDGVLDDPCGEVRAMAAWVLFESGKSDKALKTLDDMLRQHVPATLTVLNVLDWARVDVVPFAAALDKLPVDGGAMSMTGYEQRMVEYLRESRGLPVPAATKKASGEQKKKDVVDDK